MKRTVLFGTLLLVILLSVCSFCRAGGMSSVMEGIGNITIGMSKNEVVNILGKPNSPVIHDFVFGSGDKEMIVAFNKDKKVESIIIKGAKLRESILGLRIGSSSDQVKTAFGAPEYIKKYKYFNTEVWSYPSSNVYFTIKGGKVSSFAVSCIDCNKIKEALKK